MSKFLPSSNSKRFRWETEMLSHLIDCFNTWLQLSQQGGSDDIILSHSTVFSISLVSHVCTSAFS